MADIFISYSREDRDVAQTLAELLQSQGHQVWWDWNLIGGSNFRAEIRKQLDAADKTIVIWSPRSVVSAFVLDEASVGRRQGKLIPVSIEAVEPPFGFGDLHTIALTADFGEIDQVARAIDNTVAAVPPARRKTSGVLHRFGVVGGLAAVIAVGVLGWQLAGKLGGTHLARQQTFNEPRVGGGPRVDHCLTWGKECGEPAATAWCITQGFAKSTAHKVLPPKPPTYVLGDRSVCNIPECVGFSEVVCAK